MKLQKKLLIATNNPGKLKEFDEILSQHATVELTSPVEQGISVEVDETGNSYVENAILKAKAFVKASGMIVLADDSGLEVDALDGAPGIYSARYGNVRGSEQHMYLLSEMAKSNNQVRTARFRCVAALGLPNGEMFTYEGICEGEIIKEARGDKGFGYDPLFFIPQYRLTMAELESDIKNQISHRARAVQKALPKILELFS